jgi:hypothetical protein
MEAKFQQAVASQLSDIIMDRFLGFFSLPLRQPPVHGAI